MGQVTRNTFPHAVQRIFTDFKVSKIGSVSLLLIVWQTYDKAFATGAFDSVMASNIIFLVFISVVFYAVWTVICFSLSVPWISREDAIAVAYIVPAKTPAIGVPLSAAMFVGLPPKTASKLQIPMVIFQGLQVAAGSLLTLAFRQWIKNGRLRSEQSSKGGSPSEREDLEAD